MRKVRFLKSKKICLIVFGLFLILVGSAVFILNRNNSTQALAEVNPDIWDISYGFYDPDIDNGETLQTVANWTIPVEKQDEFVTKEYNFQVNIDAPVIDRSYAPGDLSVKVILPLAMPDETPWFHSPSDPITEDIGTTWKTSGFYSTTNFVTNARPVGNDFDGYNWEYTCTHGAREGQANCVFTNLFSVEEHSSVQQVIQLKYEIKAYKNESAPMFKTSYDENYNFDQSKAILNNTIESNNLELHFTREHTADWTKEQYDVHTLVQKVNSVDGLGADALDYIWMRYRFYGYGHQYDRYRRSSYEYPFDPDNLEAANTNYSVARQYHVIPVKDWAFYNSFEDGVKVMDYNKNELTRDANGEFHISETELYKQGDCNEYQYNKTRTCYEVFVGYPRDKYDSSMTVTSTVYSRGTYFLEDNEVELAQDTKEYHLDEFDLQYQGNVVGISKSSVLSACFYDGNCHPNISDQANKTEFGSDIYYYITASTQNVTQTPYDLVVGDDLVFYEDSSNGETKRLPEEAYDIKRFYVPSSVTLRNSNPLDCGSYKAAKVYYRLRGETEYRIFADNYIACSSSHARIITLPDNVVAFKYVLTGLELGATFQTGVNLRIHSQDLPREGKIINFSYVNMVKDGQVLNIPDLDSYASELSKTLVATYDADTYGHYMQRAFSAIPYTHYEVEDVINDVNPSVGYDGSPLYNQTTDGFDGYLRMGVRGTSYSLDKNTNKEIVRYSVNEEDFVTHLDLDVILPKGMEVISTPEEIIDSIDKCYNYEHNFTLDGSDQFASEQECIDYVKSHTTLKMLENWHNTGQTHLRFYFDFSERPYSNLAFGNDDENNNAFVPGYFRVAYHIPYEVYRENDANSTPNNRYKYIVNSFAPNDGSWAKDREHGLNRGSPGGYLYYGDERVILEDALGIRRCPEWADIDDDGDLTERFNHHPASTTLIPAASAVQILKETVKTDMGGSFTTKDSWSSTDTEYEYKLALRTGSNRSTNLVTYNNLEEAYGDNAFWKGSFVGVDTSFAEEQLDNDGNNIVVKTYYSTKADAGTLQEDDSWLEYNDSIDKSTVRSIAFEYLNQSGAPALLPAEAYVYTIVKMKSPTSSPLGSYAYNKFDAKWSAVDAQSGEIIQGITGIYSNTTKVALNWPFDIHVKKIWIDNDDELGLRPDEVYFELTKSDEKEDDYTLDVAGGEDAFDFLGLPIKDKDKYNVTITPIEHYTTTFRFEPETMTFIFTSTLEREPEEPHDPEEDPKDPDPTPPEDPKQPENPQDPEDPKEPEAPEGPNTPEEPETPEEPNTPEESNTSDIPNTYDSILLNSMTVVMFTTAGVATVAYAKRRKN